MRSGRKTQTIRAPWRNGRFPFKVGAVISLYTGMRTKACQKLGMGHCTKVQGFTISVTGYGRLEARLLSDTDSERFARADGFDCWADMLQWFTATHGLPFTGHVVYWQLQA